jgi:integrase
MPLHLYRRHRPECEAGHRTDSLSDEFDERRKGWRRCKCVIHCSGTLRGRYRRRQTNALAWEDARAYATTLEAAGTWETSAPMALSTVALAPVAAAPDGQATAPIGRSDANERVRITIEEGIRRYLENRKARNLAHSTFRKYVTFTKQMKIFGAGLSYVFIDQFRAEDIDSFYAGSTLGPRAKGKWLEWLRSFFAFVAYREWIAKSPVSPDLKPPVGANRLANKIPFTDEELADIIKACDQLEDQRWGNRFGSGLWTGEDLKDFCWTLTYTGLRISDVVLFDIDRLRGNDVFLRAKKNGGDVFTWIPDWLRDRLTARAARVGRRLFFIGGTYQLDTVIDIWRQRLAKVFALADCGEVSGTPHRFRHTFVRMMLERGVPVAEVADLTGDDEKTIRKHYARWVPERQARLTRILQEAFRDKPRLAPPVPAQGHRVKGRATRSGLRHQSQSLGEVSAAG